MKTMYGEVSSELKKIEEIQRTIRKKVVNFAASEINKLEDRLLAHHYDPMINVLGIKISNIASEISKITRDASEYGVTVQLIYETKSRLRENS